MTISPFLVRNVLQTYGQQHETGRKLARFQRFMGSSGQGDKVNISSEAKRKQMVERVSREIMENLIGSGSKNQTVNDVQQSLNSEFGTKFVFSYPSTGEGLQVFEKKDGKHVEVKGARKAKVMKRLWETTREKVDTTMI